MCRIVEAACANIAAKVLKQRVHTVAKATEVCMAFIELEQGDTVVVSLDTLTDPVWKWHASQRPVVSIYKDMMKRIRPNCVCRLPSRRRFRTRFRKQCRRQLCWPRRQ